MFEDLIAWQAEKLDSRHVTITIKKKSWNEEVQNISAWVYDSEICVGQIVGSAAEINLEKKKEDSEREEYARLKRKFEPAA